MTLETIPYTQYETHLPQTGQHILAQLRGPNILVYQAFNPLIAGYAVQHQQFGGPAYSFSRMSWIKPNFLWMMYRAGWAAKEQQQHVLAIEISLEHFEIILEQAVYSSFQPDLYGTRESWERAVEQSEVRLQWDPDHAPSGAKLQRRALQLGLRGAMLRRFATEWIVSIEDITPFVQEQGKRVGQAGLLVAKEQVVHLQNEQVAAKLKLGH